MTNTPIAENIILILTDQHRYDFLGCAGHPFLKTPNIDTLAEHSVRFSNAYCADPVCGPARASIFTGMYPPASGVLRNHICNSSGRPLLTDRLSSMGYYCAMMGKLHLSPSPARHGFDYKRLCDSPHAIYDKEELINNPYREWIERELFDGDAEKAEQVIAESEMLSSDNPDFWLGYNWCDDSHHITTWTGNEAVNFIKNWHKKQPLFLNVSFFGPHHPYRTCEPWDSMYDPDSVELPDASNIERDTPIFSYLISRRRKNGSKWNEKTWKKMRAYYMGAISQIDREIGRIIKELKNVGMWENTAVIFAADHGDELGDFGFVGKGLMTAGSARIPMIIKPAGDNQNGSVCDKNVNSIDLFATCLEIAGSIDWRNDLDENIESRSLVPLLNSQDKDWRNETFVMDGINPGRAMAMFRKDNLKLIRLADGDNSPLYEMYDVDQRSQDVHNIFGYKQYFDRQEYMVKSLEKWWEKQKHNYPEKETLQRLSMREINGLM